MSKLHRMYNKLFVFFDSKQELKVLACISWVKKYALFNDDIIRYFVPEVIEEKLIMVIKEIEDVGFIFQLNE